MTVVITCADARVDLTGIEGGDGEFAVLRTVGGRITPDVLAQLAILGVMHSGDTHVVVVHHTDCHTSRLADPELAAKAAGEAGVDVATIEAMVVANPSVTVTADVALLRRAVPGSKITGIVYEPETLTSHSGVMGSGPFVLLTNVLRL